MPLRIFRQETSRLLGRRKSEPSIDVNTNTVRSPSRSPTTKTAPSLSTKMECHECFCPLGIRKFKVGT